MTAATNYLKSKMLNHSLGAESFTPMPSSIYVGLLLSDPTDAGVQTSEVNKAGYAREVVSFIKSTGGASIINSNEVNFLSTTEPWGSIKYIALFDAQTNGNMLYYGAKNVEVSAGIGIQFGAGDISVSLS